MFLISWNVAGWSATSAAIRESYGSVEAFFHLTGADVICIQECKGTWTKLEASPVEMGAADPPVSKRRKVPPLVLADGEPAVPLAGASPTGTAASPGGVAGWESFWALSGKAHRGFNGVVTFVKKGLTHACDNRPFDEDDFNDEGRVVVTHHSRFTLVNVYVPNARGGSRSDYKKSFLAALRQTVLPRLRREGGKPVVLVGDLNCTYRAEDAHWTFRRLHLPRLLALRALARTQLSDKDWQAQFPHLPKPALERVINLTVNTLCASLLHDDTGDASVLASSPVALDAANSGADGAIGSPSCALSALRRSVEDAGKTRRQLLYSTESALTSLETLIDAGLLSVHAADMTKSFPLSHNEELFAVVQHAAIAPHGDESIEFLGRLLQVPITMSVTPDFVRGELLLPSEGEGLDRASTMRMWDTFLLADGDDAVSSALPYCPCPFTVWDQSKNRRLTNEGSRIDFILVDDDLTPLVVRRGLSENNTGPARKATTASPASPVSCDDDFFGELRGKPMEDGVYRAMGGGAYACASYDGTGIPPLADSARAVPFRGLPSTGLFVTPPQLSDHAGVCVRFAEKDQSGQRFVLTERTGKLVERSGKCMYRPPMGLQSFFQRKDTAQKATEASCTSDALPEPPRKVPRTAECSVTTNSQRQNDVVEISSGDD